MNGLWVIAPDVLAVLLAVALAAVGLMATFIAADFVNRVSDAEPPASGVSAPPPGAGGWVSGPPPHITGRSQTEQVEVPRHRLRAGLVAGAVGDPTPQS